MAFICNRCVKCNKNVHVLLLKQTTEGDVCEVECQPLTVSANIKKPDKSASLHGVMDSTKVYETLS